MRRMPLVTCLDLSAFSHLESKTLVKLTTIAQDVKQLCLTNRRELNFRISSEALAYPRLESLSLSGNFLTEPIMQTISLLNLVQLDLSNCIGINLETILHSDIMKRLVVLDLSHCAIHIDQMTELLTLAMTLDEKNKLTPLRMINLSHTTNVASALLGIGNPVENRVLTIMKPVPDETSTCYNLKSISLDLSYTNLTDNCAVVLCNRFRNNIRCLNLRGNKKLTEEGILAILRLTRLWHFDMTDCTQAGRSPSFAYASLPVYPPALAFSASYRGNESILKVRSYLEAHLL
jgi:hypothetical protein